VLIAFIFAASITTVRQAQEITFSHEDGLAYIKGSEFDVKKTSEAVVFEEGVAIGKMDILPKELTILSFKNILDFF
jgi:hypothetical protein